MTTEEALFDAYRNTSGYSAPCSCGGRIEAFLGAEDAVAEAVRIHQSSPLHQQWREWQEAVHALQRPTRRPCPCHQGGES